MKKQLYHLDQALTFRPFSEESRTSFRCLHVFLNYVYYARQGNMDMGSMTS